MKVIEYVDAESFRAALSGTRPKRTPRGSGPEHAIQSAILACLALRGIPAWRINSGRVKTEAGGMVRLAPAGFSDIIGIYGGRFLAIEVKVPGKQPTEAQQAFLDTVTAAGGVAFCAHSLDEVLAALEQAQGEQR
jgi:hypothetical protein